MNSSLQLKILTANCQGLGDPNKRKDVFKILKTKKYNIYFIQDTPNTNTIGIQSFI